MSISFPRRDTTIATQVVEVREYPYPTSREPGLLSASYTHNIPPEICATNDLSLNVGATNTGRAMWLARATGYNGAVRLGWQWRRNGVMLGNLFGRVELDYDVFPKQSYQFRAKIPLPKEPGTYELELGLVSELVAWFHDLGTPAIKTVVVVGSGEGH